MNWLGQVGNQDLPNQPIRNIESACDCNAHCNHNQDCEYWVHQTNGNCWLKKNYRYSDARDDCTSGSKGNTYINMIGKCDCPQFYNVYYSISGMLNRLLYRISIHRFQCNYRPDNHTTYNKPSTRFKYTSIYNGPFSNMFHNYIINLFYQKIMT